MQFTKEPNLLFPCLVMYLDLFDSFLLLGLLFMHGTNLLHLLDNQMHNFAVNESVPLQNIPLSLSAFTHWVKGSIYNLLVAQTFHADTPRVLKCWCVFTLQYYCIFIFFLVSLDFNGKLG